MTAIKPQGRAGMLALLPAFLLWGQGTPLKIPDRAPASLFHGQQGKQRTEIHFDPTTGTVTVKLLVQDPNGYFIPGIRRENFAVYVDGVRQDNVAVDIEHAPATITLLFEHGGRYPGLNRYLTEEISRAARQLAEALGRQDRMALWGYGDTVHQLTDFVPRGDALDSVLFSLAPPDVSETNLYDAVVFALKKMGPMPGRKAIILFSSGLDTFSKATYEDALAAAGKGDTPIYVVSLTPVLRQMIQLETAANPLIRTDWTALEDRLLAIAKSSGGRLYSPESTIDLSPIYDDMMENLKVRYVVTFKSPGGGSNVTHTLRVDLIDPASGKPLEIADAAGRSIHANVIVQASYTTGVTVHR